MVVQSKLFNPQGRLADKIESGEVVPLMVPMVSTSNNEDMKAVEEKEEGEGNN